MSEETAYFRFEAFADAASAQAAFEAVYPPGSAIEPALQALVAMGAQCKNAGPERVACRYVEKPGDVAGWCWHVALERRDASIERVRVNVAITGM